MHALEMQQAYRIIRLSNIYKATKIIMIGHVLAEKYWNVFWTEIIKNIALLKSCWLQITLTNVFNPLANQTDRGYCTYE